MTHIADNLTIKASIPDVDLRLIDAIWDVQKCKACDIRPTDRQTIRQSFAAVERLGVRLIALMGAQATMVCRVLPLMTKTTRVRKAPKRLWLEITHVDAGKTESKSPVLFIEFTGKKVNLGVHVPGFASEEVRKETWKRFRKHKPQIFRRLKRKKSAENGKIDEAGVAPGVWSLTKSQPPECAAPCATDMKDWLKELTDGPSKPVGAVSISASLKNAGLTVNALEAYLSEAVVVFAPFFDLEFNSKCLPFVEMRKLTVVPAAPEKNVARRA